jgi:VWFA-related protein
MISSRRSLSSQVRLAPLSATGVAFIVGLAVLGVGVGAQTTGAQDASGPPLKTQRIWITALEKNMPVDDLKKEDLRLFIGKQEQTISSLTYNSPGPAYFGLLIDVSGSRKDSLPDAEEKFAPNFFRQVMKPEDQAFIVTIGSTAQLALRPTSEPGAIQHALNVVSEQRKWGETALYDGIYEASDIGYANARRRILVLVSDGGDNASHHSLVEVRDRLRSTSTVLVYVDVSATRYLPSHRDRQAKVLDPLAEATGGAVYSVADSLSMEQAFHSIASTFRDQYALEFESAVLQSYKPSSVQIKCARRGVKILAPQEY